MSGVRYYNELGENLQKIVKRLMANQNLVKLLYYTDKDPLNQPDLTAEQIAHEVYGHLIIIVPKLDPAMTARSRVSVRVEGAVINYNNPEFRNYKLVLEIFVPFTQWLVKSDNLRPYLILGEIQKSLQGKTINGLGRIEGGEFNFNFTTEEMSSFSIEFVITAYD